MPKQIRSEVHALRTSTDVRADALRTILFFRRVVRLYATVALTHWPALGQLSAKDRVPAFEQLTHPTKQRPDVQYPVLRRVLNQMPSYLRRAAIQAAIGAVSSYLSNYDSWLTDPARPRGSRPPRLGFSNVFPSLYGGNMILEEAMLSAVRIKLLSADGQWQFTTPLKVRGRLKRLAHRLNLAPTLVLKGAKMQLVCPVEIGFIKYQKNKDIHRVCSVDVGINTAATAAIVDSTGTVIARKFLTCGRHNGQRDELAAIIAHKQHQTGSKIRRGFCKSLHRRIVGISRDAARKIASELLAFARLHQVQAFVFEDLKRWKPKGPSRKMRARFHRFQHRMLFNQVEMMGQEFGIRMMTVSASGTSRWAYDGSGKVCRDKRNHALATFAGGKQYNADLNAAYNIAARGLANVLSIKEHRPAKVPANVVRMPLVLADIWAHVQHQRKPLTAIGVTNDAPIKLLLAA